MADFIVFGDSLPGFVKTVSGNMNREDTAKFLMAQQYKIQDMRIDERKNGGGQPGGKPAAGGSGSTNAGKPAE